MSRLEKKKDVKVYKEIEIKFIYTIGLFFFVLLKTIDKVNWS